MKMRAVEMREKTVAIQLRTNSLFPSAVFTPAAARLELNSPFTVLKTATETLEAIRRKTVEEREVTTPPIIARGAHQATIVNPGVKKVSMNANTYAAPRNWDADAYEDIACRNLDEKVPCRPVFSSFKSDSGSKWKPNFGEEQVVELPSAQYESSATVYVLARPREEALASDPTRSVPDMDERSLR